MKKRNMIIEKFIRLGSVVVFDNLEVSIVVYGSVEESLFWNYIV